MNSRASIFFVDIIFEQRLPRCTDVCDVFFILLENVNKRATFFFVDIIFKQMIYRSSAVCDVIHVFINSSSYCIMLHGKTTNLKRKILLSFCGIHVYAVYDIR